MKKILQYSIILILAVLLFNSCGIEDNIIYFQEPRNIEIDDSDQTKIIVKFYGYNQEEDDGEYLFVGYDIYYKFSSSDDEKKAQVRYPIPPFNNLTFHNNALIDFSDNSRFPNDNFSDYDMEEFYQLVSIPVTEDMIKDVLKEGKSDNVRFCFDNRNIDAGKYNPDQDSNNKYIMCNDMFPEYDDYKNKRWGGLDFLGFYDEDYYNNDDYVITPSKIEGVFKYYKIDFWIIAKGFNSNSERDKNFIESLKSETFTLEFKVDISTKTP